MNGLEMARAINGTGDKGAAGKRSRGFKAFEIEPEIRNKPEVNAAVSLTRRIIEMNFGFAPMIRKKVRSLGLSRDGIVGEFSPTETESYVRRAVMMMVSYAEKIAGGQKLGAVRLGSEEDLARHLGLEFAQGRQGKVLESVLEGLCKEHASIIKDGNGIYSLQVK